MRDEQSPWSDHLVGEDDGAASLSAESTPKPILENNFLQRWMDRKDASESKHAADKKQDSELGSQMRGGFHNVFPAVANIDVVKLDRTLPADKHEAQMTEVKSNVLEQESQEIFSVPREKLAWDPEQKPHPKTISKVEKGPTEHKKDVVINATKNSGEMYLSHTNTHPEQPAKIPTSEHPDPKATESNNIVGGNEYQKPGILERQFDDEFELNNIGEQYTDNELRETDFDIKHEAMDDAGTTNQGHVREMREYLPSIGVQDNGPVPISRVIEQKRQSSEPLQIKYRPNTRESLSRLQVYDYSILAGVKLGVITAIISGLIYLIR